MQLICILRNITMHSVNILAYTLEIREPSINNLQMYLIGGKSASSILAKYSRMTNKLKNPYHILFSGCWNGRFETLAYVGQITSGWNDLCVGQIT